MDAWVTTTYPVTAAAGVDRPLSTTVKGWPHRAQPNATTATANSTGRTPVPTTSCTEHVTQTSTSAANGAWRLSPLATAKASTTRTYSTLECPKGMTIAQTSS